MKAVTVRSQPAMFGLAEQNHQRDVGKDLLRGLEILVKAAEGHPPSGGDDASKAIGGASG